MFLVRFDDVCPTMNWDIWERIECILNDYKIKPIIAVIPDNKDDTFMLDNARSDFWDRVRRWQKWGWSIGIHGYQHLYVTKCKGMLGRVSDSEFAGLSYKIQKEKLSKAKSIFEREGVISNIWIAPSHSFDRTTLRILKELGIGIVSDGISYRPFVDEEELVWVPVQVAKFKCMYSFFVCTVCLHHNDWTDKEVLRFCNNVKQFREKIVSLDYILELYSHRKYSFFDRGFRVAYNYVRRCREIQSYFSGVRLTAV